MAKWMDAYITSYRPSGDPAAYRAIMNSPAMKNILLERAEVIAEAAASSADVKKYSTPNSNVLRYLTSDWTSSDGTVTADVKSGKMRAHAMVKVRHKYKTEFADIGRNRRIDKALQKAIDAARISRKR